MTPISRGLLKALAFAPLLALACTPSPGGGDNGTGGTPNGSGGSHGSGGSSGAGSGGSQGSGGNTGSGSGGMIAPGTGGSTKDAGHDAVVDMPKGSGGTVGGSGGATGSGGSTGTGCDSTPGLVWRTANKTNYESYPAPGSQECIEFSGCDYEGQFAACGGPAKLESWVMSHNIVSVFPDFPQPGHTIPAGHTSLELHDICIKSGSHVLRVTALDTCSDADCDGCCTQNQGSAYELIDIEKYTDQRFGVDDGPIQWADLGPSKTGCN